MVGTRTEPRFAGAPVPVQAFTALVVHWTVDPGPGAAFVFQLPLVFQLVLGLAFQLVLGLAFRTVPIALHRPRTFR